MVEVVQTPVLLLPRHSIDLLPQLLAGRIFSCYYKALHFSQRILIISFLRCHDDDNDDDDDGDGDDDDDVMEHTPSAVY